MPGASSEMALQKLHAVLSKLTCKFMIEPSNAEEHHELETGVRWAYQARCDMATLFSQTEMRELEGRWERLLVFSATARNIVRAIKSETSDPTGPVSAGAGSSSSNSNGPAQNATAATSVQQVAGSIASIGNGNSYGNSYGNSNGNNYGSSYGNTNGSSSSHGASYSTLQQGSQSTVANPANFAIPSPGPLPLHMPAPITAAPIPFLALAPHGIPSHQNQQQLQLQHDGDDDGGEETSSQLPPQSPCESLTNEEFRLYLQEGDGEDFGSYTRESDMVREQLSGPGRGRGGGQGPPFQSQETFYNPDPRVHLAFGSPFTPQMPLGVDQAFPAYQSPYPPQPYIQGQYQGGVYQQQQPYQQQSYQQQQQPYQQQQQPYQQQPYQQQQYPYQHQQQPQQQQYPYQHHQQPQPQHYEQPFQQTYHPSFQQPSQQPLQQIHQPPTASHNMPHPSLPAAPSPQQAASSAPSYSNASASAPPDGGQPPDQPPDLPGPSSTTSCQQNQLRLRIWPRMWPSWDRIPSIVRPWQSFAGSELSQEARAAADLEAPPLPSLPPRNAQTSMPLPIGTPYGTTQPVRGRGLEAFHYRVYGSVALLLAARPPSSSPSARSSSSSPSGANDKGGCDGTEGLGN